MYVDFMQPWRNPAVLDTFIDILLCAVPVSVAVVTGLVIGWWWRPRSSGIMFLGLRSKLRIIWTAPPGFGARRLWFVFTAFSAFSVGRRIWLSFKGKREELDRGLVKNESGESLGMETPSGQHDIVTEKDLDHLLQLLEDRVGDVEWQRMMERSIPNMGYKAWRLEPETGPTVYRSRTVYEDISPELVRDFFWDDEFRFKWDPMLAHFKILDECPQTGMMIVRYVKKFPFFCSNREYIFGRRIWESGNTYYCLTKGVPYQGLPKLDKPRRVELYFSSWIIKPVQSRKGDGQLSACEVTLVHYEDMGIPKDAAKLGVRHGMWGAVKKTHSGMRAYQLARKCEEGMSRSAQMAHVTTKIHINNNNNSLEILPEVEHQVQQDPERKLNKGVDWRWVVVGGSVALVCGLHTGLIGKALLFGAARKLARR